MGSDGRKFMNIDLSSEEVQENYLNEEKYERYLKDMERLRRIREKSGRAREYSDKKEPGSKDSERKTSISRKNTGTSRKRRRKKRSSAFLVISLLVILLVVYGIWSLHSGRVLPTGQEASSVEASAQPEKGFYTVAVFGVDSRDGNIDRALSDVNMIAVLNWETGEVRLCSVYRDTFVQINEKGLHHKFNEAYFKGGAEQALWAMKYNLDVVPDDYVTFNWKAVIDVINILGGVDIEISDPEFAYINAFITETVEATGIGSVQLTHAGMNHLDGVQAVAYSRLRLMDTDYNRTERQRKVVSLLVEKLRSADLKKRIEVITSVLPETRTSMSVADLIPFANNMKKFSIGQTAGFPFERTTKWVEKKDCVIPVTLESNVVELHAFLYENKDYRPSESVHKVSQYIIRQTGVDLP